MVWEGREVAKRITGSTHGCIRKLHTMTEIKGKEPPLQACEKLVYTREELQRATGLSVTTLWRLEQKGLIKTVPGLRHKLYSRKSVMAFIEGARA